MLGKLKISLKDLDSITSSTLNFFFKSNLCENAELSDTFEYSNLIITNYYKEISETFLSQLEKYNQYALLLHMHGVDKIENNRVFWLEKPLQAKLLKEKIETIFSLINETNAKDEIDKVVVNPIILKGVTEKKIIPIKKINTNSQNSHLYTAVNKETGSDKLNRYRAHKYVGSNKDINPDNPEELRLIYHTPEKYLYFHLVKALNLANQNSSDVRVKTVFGSLLLDVKQQVFKFSFDETKIKFIKSNPLFIDTELKLINIKQDLSVDKKTMMSVKRMIWESAIYASKGRLPKGIDLNKNIEIKRWPNFSRLLIFRYAIQMASLWSRNKISILETAKQLQIPQRYVFTLFSAMSAIECVVIGSETNEDQKEIIQSKNTSIFGRILSHIFTKK